MRLHYVTMLGKQLTPSTARENLFSSGRGQQDSRSFAGGGPFIVSSGQFSSVDSD